MCSNEMTSCCLAKKQHLLQCRELCVSHANDSDMHVCACETEGTKIGLNYIQL